MGERHICINYVHVWCEAHTFGYYDDTKKFIVRKNEGRKRVVINLLLRSLISYINDIFILRIVKLPRAVALSNIVVKTTTYYEWKFVVSTRLKDAF